MNRAIEINQLHNEICGELRTTVQKAIRIGELLLEQKQECGHGNWLPWLKANVKFHRNTAVRYIRAYSRRHLHRGGAFGLMELTDVISTPVAEEKDSNGASKVKEAIKPVIRQIVEESIEKSTKEYGRQPMEKAELQNMIGIDSYNPITAKEDLEKVWFTVTKCCDDRWKRRFARDLMIWVSNMYPGLEEEVFSI